MENIMHDMAMRASKYVEELIKQAIEQGKLVEVVYCENCKKRDTTNCMMHETYRVEDWDYCSFAERRE